ncbi:DNA mismatch repair protein [Brachybacterium phenoliresistens]|uniref:DNA mismatch repair protein n=1 Tax=Brachybacterium phenoliresistens TaxID=396014 RepID=Z9JX05_9MICO|nr:very short patch repair endonuclease [Brachybacterium phenoliresistens]EWS82322.1 DNA mismatch repair protein [Brachybacterium phenoliresistens]
MALRPPPPSSENARRTMLANRRRDTSIELEVRRRLHAAGLRYRVDFPADASDRRRRADIVFTRARVAIFIDGCFWHGCPAHYVEPKSNTDYWRSKIARNMERDLESTARLERAGWRVLRFWEHEDPAEVAATILAVIRP